MADFDKTLSSAMYPESLLQNRRVRGLPDTNTNASEAIMQMILHSSKVTPEIAKGTRELFLKYYPIETHPNLSLQEKAEHMQVWWSSNMNTFSKLNLTRGDLHECINNG